MSDREQQVETDEFLIAQENLNETRFVAGSMALDEATYGGRAVLALDSFALTANNITYAVAGERRGYWGLFPAPGSFGRLPVWGFGEVVASGCDRLVPGERYFGCFPLSSHLVVAPEKVHADTFLDASPHRGALPQFYSVYQKVPSGQRDERAEALQVILRPLFIASYLLAEFLCDRAFFGAGCVVVSSASSRTALGFALCLQRRASQLIDLVGLTSPSNQCFASNVGGFDRVLSYREIALLDATVPTLYVDFSGDQGLLHRVHRHFGNMLKHSCRVGTTHWEASTRPPNPLGVRPELFFAPSHFADRQRQWGADGLEARFREAWLDIVPRVEPWLTFNRAAGRQAIETTYANILNGKASPGEAIVLSFRD